MGKKIATISGLLLLGILGRLMPHLPNATPITAVALAASKHLGRMWSIIIPLTAMLITDLIIGFYDLRILLSVYVSFALIGCVGWILREQRGVGTSLLVVLSASILFFLITNSAVWLFSPWYEKSVSGLLYCYALGLPFMRNMLLGDIFYSALLLGVFQTNTLRTFSSTLQNRELRNFTYNSNSLSRKCITQSLDAKTVA